MKCGEILSIYDRYCAIMTMLKADSPTAMPTWLAVYRKVTKTREDQREVKGMS
jgi:hypothetical protein